MHEYEVIIEEINPCGGEAHARKEILEVEAESPESYVAQHAKLPLLTVNRKDDGSILIVCGNDSGYQTRYTFTE